MKKLFYLILIIIITPLIVNAQETINDEKKQLPEILTDEEMPLFDNAKDLDDSNNKVFLYFYNRSKKVKAEGTVYVSFFVDTLGQAVRPEILQSQSEELNDLVIKYIEEMPSWIPGMQKGEKVEVKYTVPVKFRK